METRTEPNGEKNDSKISGEERQVIRDEIEEILNRKASRSAWIGLILSLIVVPSAYFGAQSFTKEIAESTAKEALEDYKESWDKALEDYKESWDKALEDYKDPWKEALTELVSSTTESAQAAKVALQDASDAERAATSAKTDAEKTASSLNNFSKRVRSDLRYESPQALLNDLAQSPPIQDALTSLKKDALQQITDLTSEVEQRREELEGLTKRIWELGQRKNLKIESGRVAKPGSFEDCKIKETGENNVRLCKTRVKFSSPFAESPQIILSPTNFGHRRDDDVGIILEKDEITTRGFLLVWRTWQTRVFKGGQVDWLAFGEEPKK